MRRNCWAVMSECASSADLRSIRSFLTRPTFSWLIKREKKKRILNEKSLILKKLIFHYSFPFFSLMMPGEGSGLIKRKQ